MQKPELRVIELGTRPIYEIMAIEDAIMQRAGNNISPTTLLLWYCNKPSISLGKASSMTTINQDHTDGYDIIRRISNGYTLVHGPDDPSFSFIGNLSLYPSGSEIYDAITTYTVNALTSLDIPAESKKLRRGEDLESGAGVGIHFYDSFIGEKKVAPTAQARVYNAFLQHGIFLYNPDFEKINSVLTTKTDLSKAATGIKEHSEATSQQIHHALKTALSKDYNVFEAEIETSEDMMSRGLEPKYRENVGDGHKEEDCLSAHLKKSI